MNMINALKLLALFGCVTVGASDPLDNWTASGSKIPDIDLYSIAYGDGRFVALDSTGQIALTSADNLTWLSSAGPGTNPEGAVNAMTYGAGQFVAVGANGLIGVSTDGTHWKQQEAGFLGT